MKEYKFHNPDRCSFCDSKFVGSASYTVIDDKKYHFAKCIRCKEEFLIMKIELVD